MSHRPTGTLSLLLHFGARQLPRATSEPLVDFIEHPIHRYFIAAKELEFTLGGATDQLLRIGATLAATRE